MDLSGYWVDGDVVHIGKIRIGAGARVGSRSTLLPGARIGKGAEIAAGSTVRGAVPAGQRWAGSPARRAGKSGVRWPSSRPPRSRSWALAYGVTSMLLGLLPAVAALPALAIVAAGVAGAASPAAATGGALLLVAARDAWPTCVGVRAARRWSACALLGIGMREGYHPVHSRARLAGLGHRAADGHGPRRACSRCTPACSRRCGCGCSARRSAAASRRRR